MYPLSKPLAEAIVEARNHNACVHDINILEALCATGATLESLLERKQAPYWAYWYARNVIKGRWPEAEAAIMTNPEMSNWYAYKVIKGRWPEAEATIMSDPNWASQYRKNVLKTESISMV